MKHRRTPNQRGFTLIELLVVVAVIGLVTAIAVPGFLHSLQTARQKKSLADIRTIAISITIYNNDTGNYPVAADGVVADIEPLIGHIPIIDGWSEAFRYSCSDGDVYTLVSFGSNKTADTPYVFGPIERHWDDIVVIDSQWVQWPEGVQTGDKAG